MARSCHRGLVANGEGAGHSLGGGNSSEGGGVNGEAATTASGGDVPAMVGFRWSTAVGTRSCSTGVGRRR
jgi:hypothetical protein